MVSKLFSAIIGGAAKPAQLENHAHHQFAALHVDYISDDFCTDTTESVTYNL